MPKKQKKITHSHPLSATKKEDERYPRLHIFSAEKGIPLKTILSVSWMTFPTTRTRPCSAAEHPNPGGRTAEFASSNRTLLPGSISPKVPLELVFDTIDHGICP